MNEYVKQFRELQWNLQDFRRLKDEGLKAGAPWKALMQVQQNITALEVLATAAYSLVPYGEREECFKPYEES